MSEAGETGVQCLSFRSQKGNSGSYRFGYHRHQSGEHNPGYGGDEAATQMNFKLKARVNRSSARTIRHALNQLAAKGSVSRAGE
jgi:hypothetical protein